MNFMERKGKKDQKNVSCHHLNDYSTSLYFSVLFFSSIVFTMTLCIVQNVIAIYVIFLGSSSVFALNGPGRHRRGIFSGKKNRLRPHCAVRMMQGKKQQQQQQEDEEEEEGESTVMAIMKVSRELESNVSSKCAQTSEQHFTCQKYEGRF